MHIDWHMFVPAILISLAGLVTMNSFSGENYFFFRQNIWLLVSIVVFFVAATVDWRFLRQTKVLVPIFVLTLMVLLALLLAGQATRGVQSWFQFGTFAFQPSDPAKLVIILMLSKYFSRRHIEIRNLRHILVSGAYAFLMFVLIFLQPDLGGALVIAGIWLGMVLVSGISKKHLAFVALLGAVVSLVLWMFIFAPYQKARIISFIHPLADVRGAGYNAYQSTIAVGSGGVFGKGVGQGSQSKLQFLPEYETDFIFAAFVEEWGFVGTVILLILCLILLTRVVNNAQVAATNFETFFGLGIAILFTTQIAVHAGMNMGVLPVTGITFPFMSYGGSHLVTEWLALGILSSMQRHSQGPRL
ncbi:MAG: rod shape-determining protein RodA [Candidatus Zambryskibacteria bacterium RIFCSPLOWO2_12_FULL_45_14]|uniref:Rod shape-determining protein RodA n=2 Tax=Candidatus Zambryskiibacteriota TaxID=1817925 RepID=A0A1G2UM66_9BACT|nr:MAG: rod shape-determining protein RodA [Candidatus Zambryskibacteria bacterium RIFCSPLOWO2_02_FULL_44_12b]OHB14215.1 MAG: rod shape-determining protein RodA [Candidatus Zambryskibacteria bacterium RIFCSPLOWO2_12_FULL_45_14]